jgi:alpha-1,2-mannosyltransferase
VVWHFLVTWPGDQWQVDLEVYREAGRSVLYGRPVYDVVTESPQLLPFTYPPFSALLAVPLVALPFHAAGWLWAALQVAATYLTVLIVFRPLLRRAGTWRFVAGALVTAPLLWIEPVSDGARFGQVNAFIVLAVTADLVLERGRRGSGGALTGLATAVKLTPGVFLVHLVWSRQWARARTMLAWLVGATVGAALLLPEASIAFWTQALRDPGRLGENAGTSNQSIRGVLLRSGPEGTAGTALWLLLVLVVAAVGFTLARRAHEAGELVTEVAVVGLLAVLLSPVAWIHHMAWMVVVIGALVADGRNRRRLVMAGVLLVWFWLRMPWWGAHMAAPGGWGPHWLGRSLTNFDTLGGLVALAMLWTVVPRRRVAKAGADVGPEVSAADAVASVAAHR